MTIDPLLLTLIGVALALGTALVTVVRSLDQRFAMVSSRFAETEQRLAVTLERLNRTDEGQATREAAHWEMAEYRINANAELIRHRTERFTTELARTEKLLTERIKDIEGYLDRTTTFTVRGKNQQDG